MPCGRGRIGPIDIRARPSRRRGRLLFVLFFRFFPIPPRRASPVSAPASRLSTVPPAFPMRPRFWALAARALSGWICNMRTETRGAPVRRRELRTAKAGAARRSQDVRRLGPNPPQRDGIKGRGTTAERRKAQAAKQPAAKRRRKRAADQPKAKQPKAKQPKRRCAAPLPRLLPSTAANDSVNGGPVPNRAPSPFLRRAGGDSNARSTVRQFLCDFFPLFF